MDKILKFFGIKRIIISSEKDDLLQNISIKDYNLDKKYYITDKDLFYFLAFSPEEGEEEIFLKFRLKYFWLKTKKSHDKYLISTILLLLSLIITAFTFNPIFAVLSGIFLLSGIFYKTKTSKNRGLCSFFENDLFVFD
jgi:hypothetical protein